jgi:hypothetical protein
VSVEWQVCLCVLVLRGVRVCAGEWSGQVEWCELGGSA